MKRSTKDKAKGKFHEIKGKVKEKAGQLTNNPNLEAEGKVEKSTGKVQKKIGQVEEASRNRYAGSQSDSPERERRTRRSVGVSTEKSFE